ncbi:MAG: hypothetical protein MUC97_07535 [Bernardetiaceae bacterium]|jgi:hypothetical protein|nr:hypothetical protein [Bernardetiaceae bacterium]
MKKYWPLALLQLGLALALLAATAWRTRDVLTDLALQPAQLEAYTFAQTETGLRYRFSPISNWREVVGKAKTLPAGTRAAVVKALGGVVKAYCSSAKFKSEWANKHGNVPNPADQLAELRTQQEAAKKRTQQYEEGAQQVNQQMQQMAKMLKENPQMAQTMKAQMTAEQWAQMEKLLKEGSKTEAPKDDTDWAAAEANIKANQAKYDLSKPEWAIKKRLQEFVALANTVDYQAALTKGKYGNKMVFANPDYEKKSAEWKMLYRAGPEVGQAAREFAQAWLAELK